MLRTIKELARHALHKAGVSRQLHYINHADLQSRFEAIYKDGVWKLGDASQPGSGHGSSLDATASIRSRLPQVLAGLGTKRLLDVGCGDFTWMEAVDLKCSYVGVDIVPSVIEHNQNKYGSAHRTFSVVDAVKDSLPEADAVLCREVLFHLSFADAKAVLQNVLRKPRKHIIITSDKKTKFNSDIVSGDFRYINLERRPFRFPKPSEAIPDNGLESTRYLGVWRPEDIQGKGWL